MLAVCRFSLKNSDVGQFYSALSVGLNAKLVSFAFIYALNRLEVFIKGFLSACI